ncbi:hypothetical protein Golob_004147, partial [Gossypium lobatum]|nr:hypothetical protein [Gossypium lobatum]
KERNEVIHRNLGGGKPTPCPPRDRHCHSQGYAKICPPDCSSPKGNCVTRATQMNGY